MRDYYHARLKFKYRMQNSIVSKIIPQTDRRSHGRTSVGECGPRRYKLVPFTIESKRKIRHRHRTFS